MTATATDKDLFLDHFAQLDNRWEEAPFAALRLAGRKRFRELGFPGPKTEDWRFTNLGALLKVPFEPALEEADVTVPKSTGAIRLAFVNGHYAPRYSATAGLPRGVLVGNLANNVTQAERHLGKLAETKDHIFTALNTGSLRGGAFVWVPDGAVVETPIEILHLASSDRPLAIHPRTLIVLGKNSQANVAECYRGDSSYLNNAVTEIVVGDHAVLEHCKVQEEDRDAFHLSNTQVVLGGQSRFTSQYVSLGAKLSRNEVRVRFDGEGSEATVNGLYQGSGHQHVDNFTVIDHARPNCASHELYKGILGDKAHGVFNGKIFVRPDAQKTDAKQTNKVLLLSDSATINTKPQLEIFADDVKCTHGATVGQLDDEQLFYLRTRGLDLEEARNVLLYAFANDILGRIKNEGIRKAVSSQWSVVSGSQTIDD